MRIVFVFIVFITGIFCLFDEEIVMEKPVYGSSLFFRKINDSHFYISNSLTNYIFNIRTGEKKPFGGIIPFSSSIYEPFVLLEKNIPSYFVDANSYNNFIQIYNISGNKYKEYTSLKVKKEYKRKFCKLEIPNDNKFVIGIEDENHKFYVRVITANGTELFKSQEVDIKGSDDFYVYTSVYGSYKSIITIVFYESKFVMHQWFRNGNSQVYYRTDTALTNQFIRQTYSQMSTNGIFCAQEEGDVNCHRIAVNYNAGFSIKNFNIQMLQECKSHFKLNEFNREKYVVSCLNIRNEYTIQLFNINLVRDFDMNGITIFKDEENSNYEYDVLKGKENELVILKADLSHNKYYIEPFNFIKNAQNMYQLCPDGCQDCYFLKQLGIIYPNNTLSQETTLNCTLCKFNRYFADNYGDICFLEKEKPDGYEFIDGYNKFSSCNYCCKTKNKDYICDACFSKNYEFYVDKADSGKCKQQCDGEYKYINYEKKNCYSSCNGISNCNSFSEYIKIVNDLNEEGGNSEGDNQENTANNNSSQWCLRRC